MGRKRKPGLEWLDPENGAQRQWAVDYLWTKGFEISDKENRAGSPTHFARHAELLELGAKIELRNDGREVLQDMKAAWRQKNGRDSAKGKKVCAFTLNTSAKTNLREMAENQGKSATALLESLITKAYKAHIRKRQTQQSNLVQRTARNYSFQGPNNTGERGNRELQKTAHPPETTVEDDVITVREDTEVYSGAPRPLPIAEAFQEQPRTNTPLPESLHGSQVPGTTTIADELQPEQSAAVNLSPQPTDNAPNCAQVDAQLTTMKIGVQKKKPFTIPRYLLLKPWDADQSD
ncbi:hypothetical protein [Pseudomonas fluorescens]|uniref:hypothetical protein n=1 Tax=Pseudomonas fluorescens TaxID=294 RepID=UPI002003AF23|nr:hypothetical protein [Pseudomonas fluorescens]MCK3830140.1 hypothetical protein [Pseudomonas fluorescens]